MFSSGQHAQCRNQNGVSRAVRCVGSALDRPAGFQRLAKSQLVDEAAQVNESGLAGQVFSVNWT
jgi:hypothetical protein